MEKIIEFLVLYGIIGLFLVVTAWYARKPGILLEGKTVLKFNGFIAGLAIIFMGFALFLPFYSPKKVEPSNATIDSIIMITIAVLCFSMGYYLLRWYRFHRVFYNEKEIEVIDWRSRSKIFSWTEIKSVELKAMKSKYVLLLNSGETVDVHQYFTGAENFIAEVKRRIGS